MAGSGWWRWRGWSPVGTRATSFAFYSRSSLHHLKRDQIEATYDIEAPVRRIGKYSKAIYAKK